MKHEIGSMVHKHIDSVIHQIVAMAAAISMLKGKRKIDVSHLQPVRTYVATKCHSGMKGGQSMPSDFYGYPHPAYSSSHANAGVQVSSIMWNKHEARPAQGPAQSGGGKDKDTLVMEIKSVLKDLNAEASKPAIIEMKEIIEGHVVCFVNDMKTASPLTVKKLEKVLKMSHHAAFEK